MDETSAAERRANRVPWNIHAHAKPGSRFATPQEFLAGIPMAVRRDMAKDIVARALAQAADAEGVLWDFDMPEFYATYVADVLNQDSADDELATRLVYDRFTAVALLSYMGSLMLDDGLLANRGNGDSADYRLTLPGVAGGE